VEQHKDAATYPQATPFHSSWDFLQEACSSSVVVIIISTLSVLDTAASYYKKFKTLVDSTTRKIEEHCPSAMAISYGLM
jgi:hypothetical protein